jgi:iron complex outermembrane receptor protein
MAFNDYGFGANQSADAHSDSKQISPRVSYHGTLGATAVSAIVGLDKADWDYTRKVTYSGFLGADEKSHQTNRASYLKTDFLFPSQTRLVMGVRQERVKQDYADPLAPSTSSTNNKLKAWELGLNQTLSAQWNGYVRSAQSFRIANVDENRYLVSALRPQLAKDAELGLRFNGVASSAALRLFKQGTVDEIAYYNPTFSNINLDPIRRTGIELEGRTQLDRSWSLGGSLQNIKAVFSSGANQGKTPPHVSKLNATVRVGYAINTAQQVELAVQHRSAAVLGNDWSNSCTQKTPSRTTLDALYRYRASPDKGWSVTAGIDNLTNANTFSWAFTNAACSPVNVYPEVGRSLKVNARYQF